MLWLLEAKGQEMRREKWPLTGKDCQAGLKPQSFIPVCGSLACATASIPNSDFFVIWQRIVKSHQALARLLLAGGVGVGGHTCFGL